MGIITACSNNLEKLQLWNNLTEASGLAGYVPLDEKYQLGTGGVSVREVVIETGVGAEKSTIKFQKNAISRVLTIHE